MDEVWERAIEIALDGQTDCFSVRTLTLDGAVKCVHGRLPPRNLLERFQRLEHLSIANIGVSSLENFPRLRNLQKLNLSDNRIAGGLEYLVEANLESLRDLDLSNNRIQHLHDLASLSRLRLIYLDLYECPVTRVKDYRLKVFSMIRSLKYLDKMDADENERPESDEEEEEEDEDEEDEEDEDPGSGEVDGEYRTGKLENGSSVGGIVDVDEDDESDADEEAEITGAINGVSRGRQHQANGTMSAAYGDGGVEDTGGDEVDDDYVEDVDDGDDDDVDTDEEDDEDDNEEDVDDEEDDVQKNVSALANKDGVIDGHEQGEQGDEDENGVIGEDEQDIDDDEDDDDDDELAEEEDEEDDVGADYLVRPVDRQGPEIGGDGLHDSDEEVEEVDEADEVRQMHSSTPLKRKRGGGEFGEHVDDTKMSKRQ